MFYDISDMSMTGSSSVTNLPKKKGLEGIDVGEGSSSSPPPSKKPKKGIVNHRSG